MQEKFHASFNVSKHHQGLIYYACINQAILSPVKQIYIANLCIKVGGEHSDALFKTVTTTDDMMSTADDFGISIPKLWRMVKKFYEAFDINVIAK